MNGCFPLFSFGELSGIQFFFKKWILCVIGSLQNMIFMLSLVIKGILHK